MLAWIARHRHTQAMTKATFEHLAFNVPDMDAMTDWYCTHLGMKIARLDAGKKVFLADHTGTVVLELYSNSDEAMLPSRKPLPLEIHLAFVVEDADAVVAELEAAGAELISRQPPDESGDVLCFLRDPFGLPIQVLTRKVPLT